MSPKLAPRDVLGTTLVELGEKDPNIVVLDADFCTPGKTAAFKDRFPERFIQVGIAEQNMMSIAAGLATVGFTCFASTICAFCSRRACDQVMASIALPGLNVKIVGLYAGLFVGKNGATHQSLEDIGIMRSLANMTVVQPVDAVETRRILQYAARYRGPMYIRVGRDPVPQFVPDNYEFNLGRSVTLRAGGDLTLMAYGDLMENTMIAAERLARQGVQSRVINMSSLKPVDRDAIVQAARETGRIRYGGQPQHLRRPGHSRGGGGGGRSAGAPQTRRSEGRFRQVRQQRADDETVRGPGRGHRAGSARTVEAMRMIFHFAGRTTGSKTPSPGFANDF